MTTTCMRDSTIGDAWIQQACAQTPCGPVMVGGVATENLLTGPVRIAFTQNLFTPEVGVDDQGRPTSKWNCAFLFSPFTDVMPLVQARHDILLQNVPQKLNPANNHWGGVKETLLDQGAKHQWGGFTEGLWYINCTTYRQPQIVDQQYNPVLDPSMVDPGMWVIGCVLPKFYSHPTGGVGVAMRLQSIMLLAKDTSLASSGPPPSTAFSGVNIAPPVGGAPEGFGAPAAAPQAATQNWQQPAALMPPAQPQQQPQQAFAPAAAAPMPVAAPVAAPVAPVATMPAPQPYAQPAAAPAAVAPMPVAVAPMPVAAPVAAPAPVPDPNAPPMTRQDFDDEIPF